MARLGPSDFPVACVAGHPHPVNGDFHEQENVPAEQPPSRQGARLPSPDAHPRGSRHPLRASPQGPLEALRVRRASPEIVLAWRHRVTLGDDYRRIVRKGRRVGGAVCITHAVFRTPADPARFGFIISKATGNSPERNLIRRRMKAVAHRHIREGLTGMDIVIRALPASSPADYGTIDAEMTRAIEKLVRLREQETASRAGVGAP